MLVPVAMSSRTLCDCSGGSVYGQASSRYVGNGGPVTGKRLWRLGAGTAERETAFGAQEKAAIGVPTGDEVAGRCDEGRHPTTGSHAAPAKRRDPEKFLAKCRK